MQLAHHLFKHDFGKHAQDLFRYHVLVDEEGKKMLDEIPSQQRSHYIRELLKEKRLKEVEKSQSKRVRLAV